LSGAGFPEFSQPSSKLVRRAEISSKRRLVETPRPWRLSVAMDVARCTKNWHGPVDDLHSIENKRLKIANF
jgi:hypothetical protein